MATRRKMCIFKEVWVLQKWNTWTLTQQLYIFATHRVNAFFCYLQHWTTFFIFFATNKISLFSFCDQSSSELLSSSASDRSAMGNRKMAATPLSWVSSEETVKRWYINSWQYIDSTSQQAAGWLCQGRGLQKWPSLIGRTHSAAALTCASPHS